VKIECNETSLFAIWWSWCLEVAHRLSLGLVSLSGQLQLSLLKSVRLMKCFKLIAEWWLHLRNLITSFDRCIHYFILYINGGCILFFVISIRLILAKRNGFFCIRGTSLSRLFEYLALGVILLGLMGLLNIWCLLDGRFVIGLPLLGDELLELSLWVGQIDYSLVNGLMQLDWCGESTALNPWPLDINLMQVFKAELDHVDGFWKFLLLYVLLHHVFDQRELNVFVVWRSWLICGPNAGSLECF
jgi:hypothetical protein